MSALQSGHLSPRWCTVSAHDSQKRWCPQGTRAIRGSLRLIRHTSQQSSDVLVAGSDFTAAFCGGVWSVVCASSSSAPSSSSSESPRRWLFNAVLWAPMLWLMASKNRIGVYALSWAHFSQAFDHSCIVHSRIVHPCHMVPHCPLLQCPPCHIVMIFPLLQIPSLQHGADLSTPALSTPSNSAFPFIFLSIFVCFLP